MFKGAEKKPCGWSAVLEGKLGARSGRVSVKDSHSLLNLLSIYGIVANREDT